MTELRAACRPRYGRLVAAGSALAVTAVTLLAGVGVLPDRSPVDARPGTAPDVVLAAVNLPEPGRSPHPDADPGTRLYGPVPWQGAAPERNALPQGSGSGRRVVFAIGEQRVWLVDAADEVLTSYLASGSLSKNLKPGTYRVYSRSRRAVGIGDSGAMEYFVRFARGANAAIGFHSIPKKDGSPLQTRSQLGTPQSHGCVRQARPDAKRLWDFAPEGTTVVVTA